MWVVGRGYYLWRRIAGLGQGDIKMMFLIGAFLGPKGVLSTVVCASVAALLWAGWLAVRGRAGWRTALPYGTFLALGGLLQLFFGDAIEKGYWQFSIALTERFL